MTDKETPSQELWNCRKERDRWKRKYDNLKAQWDEKFNNIGEPRTMENWKNDGKRKEVPTKLPRVRWVEANDRMRQLAEEYTSGPAPLLLPDAHTLTQIYELAAMQCTYKEIAAELNVSSSTLQKFRNEFPEVEAAIDRGKDAGKLALRRLQFEQAQDSVPMSIHLGKNILDQSDKVKTEVSASSNFLTALMSLPDDREIIETIEGPANVFVPQPLKGDTE